MKNPNPLGAILKSPIVKATLMKQLTKIMKDHKITVIALTMDKEDINATPYFEEMKILPKKDFEEILKMVK